MRAAIILLTTGLVGRALAGINCKGSVHCSLFPSFRTQWFPSHHHSKYLYQLISHLPRDAWIPNDEPIACTRDICAHIQNVIEGGLSGQMVAAMALQIVNHGCSRCGHCPLDYPENNYNDLGVLVFDRNKEPCTIHGICPYFTERYPNATSVYPLDDIQDILRKFVHEV